MKNNQEAEIGMFTTFKNILKYNYKLVKTSGFQDVATEKIIFLKEIPNLYKSWITAKGYKPLSINVYCTYRCNLRCKQCGFGIDAVPKTLYRDELTTDQYFEFFKEAGELGTVKLHFTGGEPLLRHDIVELVAHAKKHIPFVNFTTNGTLITKSLAEKLVKNLDAIKFSIDGDERAHDITRGVNGSWKKSVEGLRNIIEAKRKWNPNLMVGINCLVNAINYKTTDEMIDMLHESGNPDLVQFSPLFEYEEIKEEGNGDEERLFLTEPEAKFFVENVIPKIKSKAEKYGIAMQSNQAWEYTNVEGLSEKYMINYCFLPWSWLILSAQGNIFPCGATQYDNLFGKDVETRYKYIMGNIKSNSLKEIWNNQKYIDFRKKCNPLSHDICNYCCHIRGVKSIIDQLDNAPLIGALPVGSRSFIAYLLSVEPSIVSTFHKNIAFMAKRGDL